MKKLSLKNISSAVMFAALVSFTGCASTNSDTETKPEVPLLKGNGVVKMDDFAREMVASMKTGWNLGNTFEANGNIDKFSNQNQGIGSVTCWGMSEPKKELFDAVAAAGFKTVRIPVSWSNHICDKNYTIDSAWMAKVKELVDWAISDNLIVILNIFFGERI